METIAENIIEKLSSVDSELKIKLTEIGPEEAAELLSMNTNNRPVNNKQIEFLTMEMENGRWKGNPQPIIISKTNKILDGQHRLKSIINSGRSFFFLVVYNADDGLFEVIDTGKRRTSSDALAIAGYKNYAQLSATIKFILSYENRERSYDSQGSYRYVSNQEVLEFAEEHPELQEIIRFTYGWYQKFYQALLHSFIAGFYYVFSEIDEEDAERFFGKLCLGLHINDTRDPVSVARNIFLADKQSITKMPPKARATVVVKAWNHMRRGDKVENIKLSLKEPIPRPI